MLASSAQAGLMITSVEMLIAETSFKVRRGTDFQDALDTFETAYANRPVCAISLESFDGVGRAFNCDGAKANTGTQFTITGKNTGITQMQFGLDWGRGGFSEIAFGKDSQVEKYTHNIWWGRKWRNSNVLNFEFASTGNFTMTLLGFEDCCNGINSARWRSVDVAGGQPLTRGAPQVGPWETLSVNATAVPVPSALSLIGLGLFGLAFGRRRVAV